MPDWSGRFEAFDLFLPPANVVGIGGSTGGAAVWLEEYLEVDVAGGVT